MVDHRNHIGESVIFTVNLLWHGWSHKAIWWVQCIAMMYIFSKKFIVSIVCSEPNATYSIAFLKNITFTCYLPCIDHHIDFSLAWDLLSFVPVIKSVALIKFKLHDSTHIPRWALIKLQFYWKPQMEEGMGAVQMQHK